MRSGCVLWDWLDLQLLSCTGKDAEHLLTPEGNQCLFYSQSFSKEINSTIVSHYYTQEFRHAPPWTQWFSIWPWVAANVQDWPERGSCLRLIGRTITQLRWLLTIIARLQTLLSPFSPSACLESLFCPPHNFLPPIHPRSLSVAFAPLYLFLTVGQVCADAFHTMIPFTQRSAHNDCKLSLMAHNSQFCLSTAGIF